MVKPTFSIKKCNFKTRLPVGPLIAARAATKLATQALARRADIGIDSITIQSKQTGGFRFPKFAKREQTAHATHGQA